MKGLRKEGLDRREFLKRAGVAAAGLGLMACAPAAAPTATPTKAPAAATPASAATAAPKTSGASLPAGGPDWTAKLYEAAKKEGELMVYNVQTTNDWEQTSAAFAKKFPGVKVNGWTGSSEPIREKLLAETKAGKPICDVVHTAFADIFIYKQEGMLDKYLSPELKSFDPQYYDPEGLWTVDVYYPYVIEYNTKAIPKEQAPKSNEDLLKPEFKGKLGLEANAVPWFTSMLRIMGRDKGIDYAKKLAEQKPRLIAGHSGLQKLVESGEIPIVVYEYSMFLVPAKAKGSPVEWVMPTQKVPASFLWLGLPKNGPHPNAARLLIDYLLSEEGQMLYAQQTYIPRRKGLNLGELAAFANLDLLVPDANWGQEVLSNDKLFREIFGKP